MRGDVRNSYASAYDQQHLNAPTGFNNPGKNTHAGPARDHQGASIVHPLYLVHSCCVLLCLVKLSSLNVMVHINSKDKFPPLPAQSFPVMHHTERWDALVHIFTFPGEAARHGPPHGVSSLAHASQGRCAPSCTAVQQQSVFQYPLDEVSGRFCIPSASHGLTPHALFPPHTSS